MTVAVRILHTAIYGVMVASIFYILYVGISGQFIPDVLYVALGLVTMECVVFVGNGWKCPLTTVAVSVAGREGKDYAPMIPEKLGRYTATLFGSIFVLGLIMLLARFVFRW